MQAHSKAAASVSPTPSLRHFELAVGQAIRKLNDEAYPAKIAEYLTQTRGRHVSIAQVFVCLQRFEDKGFVYFTELPPSPVVGGRRRKLFHLKESGVQAMRESMVAYRVLASDKEETHDEQEVPATG